MPKQPYRPFERTKVEIETSIKQTIETLKKFGVTKYGSAFDENRVQFHFEFEGLVYNFALDFPHHVAEEEQKRLWRVFYNSVKHDLISVTEGVFKMHEKFTWNIVDPQTGRTWGEGRGTEIVEKLRLTPESRPAPKALPKGED